jgi:arginase family protein
MHIDAHIDCTDRIADSTLHHGSPFKNAVLDGVLDPKRTIHIAIRDPAGEFENFAHETGQTVIDIDQFYDLGVKGVVAEVRRIVGDGPTYISSKGERSRRGCFSWQEITSPPIRRNSLSLAMKPVIGSLGILS